MNKRIERTLLNWRWWALLPVIVLLLPVLVVDAILAGLEWVADFLHYRVHRWRAELGATVRPVIQWAKLRAGNRGGE